MNQKIGLVFGVVIVGLAIIANDQRIYSNDFMSDADNGISRLDDELIERALASTSSTLPTEAEIISSNDLVERPTLPNLELITSEEVVNPEEETLNKPSDLVPVTLYLFEAYVPTKEKVNGNEVEKMVYYNSDPQFSNQMPTIQGTLEYQYNFDDQGVSRTVLMLEANYSSATISIGPILVKDRSNVYYMDEEGNPVQGQLFSNSSRGEEVLEFSTGPYRQYRFVFCADLMKCSETRSKELEKKDSESAEQFDVQDSEVTFETQEVIESQEIIEAQEKTIDEVEVEQQVNVDEDEAVIEARAQNAINTEGDFEGFINSKVEENEPQSEMDNEQEEKLEASEESGSSDFIEKNEYLKQPEDEVVTYSAVQIEKDGERRFKF